LYLYAPTREKMPAKVRALIDFMVEKRDLVGGMGKPAVSKRPKKQTTAI